MQAFFIFIYSPPITRFIPWMTPTCTPSCYKANLTRKGGKRKSGHQLRSPLLCYIYWLVIPFLIVPFLTGLAVKFTGFVSLHPGRHIFTNHLEFID